MLRSRFTNYVRQQAAAGRLVVQPRMGFGQWQQMRAGLRAVRDVGGPRIGTITLDSYTRAGDYAGAARRLAHGDKLNGYPIMTFPVFSSRALLDGLYDDDFPVQVRHGTPLPGNIFKRLTEIGLDATEGGPVSYCLPYSRVPLRDAIRAWREACKSLVECAPAAHVESFGGCLLGQLCPPSMLISISLLEGMFFASCGLCSVSLSYAQGTSEKQDRAALCVLRELAAVHLPRVDWHLVCYTYMGVYPRTTIGALNLLRSSTRLAKSTGCERLIVKTKAESRQIPTVADNIEAVQIAQAAAAETVHNPHLDDEELECYEEIKEETQAILAAVLNLSPDIGTALQRGFAQGLLDIPYCLHADNPGRTRCHIDAAGALRWDCRGRLPIRPARRNRSTAGGVSSAELLHMLYYMANRYDSGATA